MACTDLASSEGVCTEISEGFKTKNDLTVPIGRNKDNKICKKVRSGRIFVYTVKIYKRNKVV